MSSLSCQVSADFLVLTAFVSSHFFFLQKILRRPSQGVGFDVTSTE